MKNIKSLWGMFVSVCLCFAFFGVQTAPSVWFLCVQESCLGWFLSLQEQNTLNNLPTWNRAQINCWRWHFTNTMEQNTSRGADSHFLIKKLPGGTQMFITTFTTASHQNAILWGLWMLLGVSGRCMACTLVGEVHEILCHFRVLFSLNYLWVGMFET
jgi:hypothetical protein